MKYYIIAGEASGDLHGSNVVKALRRMDAQAEIRAWGGDLMAEAGATIVKHYRDLAFMGFVEVMQHLGTILSNIKFCKQDITAFQPDVILFVDYPGFNMRMAKWAFLQGYKTTYYISPTVWAWKENRVHHIHKYVHEMMVILPFEEPFYAKYGYKVHYVGHPLVEVIEQELQRNVLKEPAARKTIALLPGSRTQEITKLLPVMLEVVAHFSDFDIVIAQAPGQEADLYGSILSAASVKNVKLVKGKTYEVLKAADAAIVTSGTATLETALLGVPQVVVYKTNSLTYAIARRLVKAKYISLVNLILDKPVVTELIQDECSVARLHHELQEITQNGDNIDRMQTDYTRIWQMLAQERKTSERVAEIVINAARARQ